jgi:hypothetical protein
MKLKTIKKTYIINGNELLEKIGIENCILEKIVFDNWIFNDVAIDVIQTIEE